MPSSRAEWDRLTRQTKAKDGCAIHSRGQGILVHWGTIPTQGRAWKLMPKYIGPYEVTKSHPMSCATLWTYLWNSRHKGFILRSMFPDFVTTSVMMTRYSPDVKFAPTTTSVTPKTTNGWWTKYSPTNGTGTRYCSLSNGILVTPPGSHTRVQRLGGSRSIPRTSRYQW